MKQLSVVLICLILLGCTAVETRPTGFDSDDFSAISFTRVELKGGDNSVSMRDIESYLHFKTLAYDKKAVSVEPLADGEDTLLYVINYDEGWEIIAGDKRAPVRLAYGESGAFSSETENVEMLAWIESLAADVQALKHMEDFSTCTEEQLSNMQSSRKFWALVCREIDAPCPMTRYDHINDSLIIPGFLIEGHWELYASNMTAEVYDSLRLMQTEWGQSTNHYNEYCPYTTSPSDGTRAHAGCVPVAGAQMLYYLHDNLSFPTEAPDSATCTGCVGFNTYTQTIGGPSSTTWNYMLHNYQNERGYRSAAVLIADVGKKVHVSYGNNGSGAHESNLPDDVFAPYGIDCSFDDYNASTVTQSLLNNMPVIIGAFGVRNYILGIFPQYEHGHCFIIDGYRRYRNHYTYYYEWVWDNGHGGIPVPSLPEMMVDEYSSPFIADFQMNWGWAGTDNDSYFAKSGNWEITLNDGTICNYVYQRTMIYGFSPSE